MSSKTVTLYSSVLTSNPKHLIQTNLNPTQMDVHPAAWDFHFVLLFLLFLLSLLFLLFLLFKKLVHSNDEPVCKHCECVLCVIGGFVSQFDIYTRNC